MTARVEMGGRACGGRVRRVPRLAAIGGKIAERSQQATNAIEALELATVNGARALGRDDLGRIAAGCKADLVLVDVTRPRAA